MKLKTAIYKVTVGCCDDEIDTDNLRGESVAATDVVAAMKKVRLNKGEYYSEVQLLNRATK